MDEHIDEKVAEPTHATNEQHAPQRQHMSPLASSQHTHSVVDHHNIDECAVLIIPLDKRVTPQMVANKFVKYGHILHVYAIKKSSSCIVIFSKPSEAVNCIRLFENHDKVRVTTPDQRDWNMCDEECISPPLPTATTPSSSLSQSPLSSMAMDEKQAAAVVTHKIATHEVSMSRVTAMYKQRHAYEMLVENDKVESRRRAQHNGAMLSRTRAMSETSEELFAYLSSMIELEVRHEENVHKLVTRTFGSGESGGSVHSAGIAIDALLKNRYEQFNDIHERVFKPILLSAQKYRGKLSAHQSFVENRIRKVHARCEEHKTKMSEEWNKYQHVLNRVLKLEQMQLENGANNHDNKKSSSNHHNADALLLQSCDPFLAGKAYDCAQTQYKQALTAYNEEMTRLFDKIVAEDKKRIDGIQSILIDYFLAEKAKAMNHMKLIESSLEYIKCVDKEQDTREFRKRFSHLHHHHDIETANSQNNNDNKNKNKNKNVSESDETFWTHSKQLSDLILDDVVQCGTIYRPGRIISSNWKPLYANVTRFGWFHAFEHQHDMKPILSVFLKGTDIKLKDNDKQAQLFTFEIVVPNASWFSLTGTPTIHCYKVDKHQECLAWINNLRKYSK
eukprot:CAMPEP_0202689414 /NCGR_PEP_ID=MMETSP1385-20130828/4681_1 /ASSEMBLY_ACC=CAM_ASM_000861 /TAXON_ID=933848 /ORGANISM="Elphidium margaritaceum" /LENGTH=616 /DNA_ID=CAMNT_0049344543 /DNA_START=104 /DNA_END=1954 /DNA_ORIENTATION=-